MRIHLILISLFVLTFMMISCDKEEVTISDPDEPEIIEPQPTIDTLITTAGIEYVRTPAEHFDNLPDWPYPYQYIEIEGLRQAFAEAGPADGEVVLLLHGQPSWSYLYRKMIPVLADAGYRVIAMDHLGMGRSDKPVDIEAYSYLGHAERLEAFIKGLGLQDINLFVQDWGSLIGLRVAGLNTEWFASIAVGNGALPVVPASAPLYNDVENPDEIVEMTSPYANIPAQQVPFYDGCDLLYEEQEIDFQDWMNYSMKAASFTASEVLEALTWFDLPDDEAAAYDAPFPSREYMAGVRKFPSLINDLPGLNEDAWAGLTAFEKPFITLWATNDAGNLGSCETQQHLIDNIPGAVGQAHDRLPESSHFLQDDQGKEIARRLVEFYRKNKEPRLAFEILQVVAPDEIITWLGLEVTREEFDAIQLPQGWFKNQPREGRVDQGSFARSPSATADGEFVEAEHFGHSWRHIATVRETNIAMDDLSLLTGNKIDKYHQIGFNPGRTLNIITSPEGERYILVSRDADRTTDVPTIPDNWQRSDTLIQSEWIIQLPNPTINIRADNEDSFQGPIPK